MVGFHGAGFANIAFSTRRLCVTEISTLMRDDLATKRLCSDDPELEAERGEKWSDVFGPWRSNREVLEPWQPWAAWQTYYLPALALTPHHPALPQVPWRLRPSSELRPCHGNTSHWVPTARRDVLYKSIPLVTLQNHDSLTIASLVDSCLRYHVSGSPPDTSIEINESATASERGGSRPSRYPMLYPSVL